MKRRLLIGALGLVAVAVLATVVCYWTGWNTARAAAEAIALGKQAAPDFAPTSDYSDQLQNPPRGYVRVSTLLDENTFLGESPAEFQVNFALTNMQDDRIPMVPLSVMVKLGLTGWKVIGFGSGG